MLNKQLRSAFHLYFLCGSFIFGWWAFAFHEISSPLPAAIAVDPLPFHQIISQLSPLSRDVLHEALAGNFKIMSEFITNWEKDAQLLTDLGIPHIHHLTREEHLKAQILANLIKNLSPDELKKANYGLRKPSITDGNGQQIFLQDSFCRFLPQTYVAASFLLAIAEPQELIAIPKGLRALPQLYPVKVLSQIPLDTDRCYSEKIFLANPHLAFIAPYSHPSSMQTLLQQKILLYNAPTIHTLSDIQHLLVEIGHASNHPIEAEFLSIFIAAGLNSIDNRLRALASNLNSFSPPKKLLYLSYYQHYYTPTKKCLTGQLLERASNCYFGLKMPETDEEKWMTLFDREKIFTLNPDYLILSIADAGNSPAQLKHQSILRDLPALQNKKIVFVDEAVQDSPTQYIVLAYFDLLHSLEKLTSL